MALFVIAASAAAWIQMTTTAARTEVSVDRRRDAVELATAELEVLRVTPGIASGKSSGESQLRRPNDSRRQQGHSTETIAADGHDFDVSDTSSIPGRTRGVTWWSS